MKARYTFVYNRKDKLNADGEALIQLEVYLKRKRKYISTGIYIKPNQWNKRTRAIQKHKMQLALNSKLTELQTKIETYELKLGEAFDLNRIDECLSGNLDSFNIWVETILTNENKIKESTRYRYQSELKRLNDLYPHLAFASITPSFILKIDDQLRSNGLMTNSVYNFHTFMRRFVKMAITKDLIDKNPYANFSVRQGKEEREYLTWDELKSIEALRIGNPSIQNTINMFLFSCYTGLRFSDTNLIKWEQIHNNNTLHVTMMKTGDAVNLPLDLLFDGKPLKLIQSLSNPDTIFRPITASNVNKHLKTIAQLIGYKKRLTYHVSRHTFGTLMADISGDPFIVKQLMGHRNITTTMEYFHENEEMRNKKLAKLDWDTPYQKLVSQ